jgi:hypothetical protein
MTEMTEMTGDSTECRWHPRQAAVGGGDCVVCVKQDPDGPALEVSQVIEGMAHHRDLDRVDIPILMAVRNPGDVPVAMRIVHRAFVKASLKRFRFRPEGPSGKKGWEEKDPYKQQLMDVLRGLYAARLREDPENPRTALFYRRVNCLGTQQEPETLSLDGPDGCFLQEDEFDPPPQFDQGETPSFCSYMLPPVAPRQADLFVLWLTLEGPSYQRLVRQGGMFTVDSHSRLLRQIKAFDVDLASENGRDFYCRHVAPRQAIISPAAYDIVIFQGDMGDPIAVEAGSICILQVQPEDKSLDSKVLWFFGQPEEFYLVLRYESVPAEPRPATNGFVVGKRATLV